MCIRDRGSSAFVAAVAAAACGEDPALPDTARTWLTRMCALAPPPKTEAQLAEEAEREAEELRKKEAEGDAYVPPPPPPPHPRWRVAAKAMRLATALARSPSHRARILRVMEPARTPITVESLRAEREDAEKERDGETKTETKKPACLLYTSPSPRDLSTSRMPSSA